MNKLFSLSLLMGITAVSCYGMDKAEEAAIKFNKNKDFFSNKLKINNTEATVVSYFNLKDYKEIIEKILKPDTANNYDIRKLETEYCKLARTSQPWYTKRRGIIGFLAGMAVMVPFFVYPSKKSSKSE